MCSIRLSEPLLKLRPRKDLVEVLEDTVPVNRHGPKCVLLFTDPVLVFDLFMSL